MLTAVDHIVLGAADPTKAIGTFEALGFQVSTIGASGSTPTAGYVVFDDFYLDLRDLADFECRAGSIAEGLKQIALRSDQLESDIARLESTGLYVSELVEDAVDGPGGSLRRRSATIEFFTSVRLVEHRHAGEARWEYLGGAAGHPNTALSLERTYLAVEAIDRDLPLFEAVFGMAAPEPEMGTVIMSLMSVFYLGEIGIAIAEPRGPGPTAEALASNGPGLFQVLFRAAHLDEAARFMTRNGLPEPERGTRLSGESALLVRPEVACGAFVALAGPA